MKPKFRESVAGLVASLTGAELGISQFLIDIRIYTGFRINEIATDRLLLLN